MLSKFKNKLVYINFALLLIFCVLAGLSHTSKVLAISNPYENLKVFSEVLSLVEKNYVTEVKPDKLIHGAIKGMLRELDPHTSFMPQEAYKEMQVETEGKFGGLGIEITIKDDFLTVVSPIEGTPAFEAGIKAADRIIKVEGESTKDLSLIEAVKMLRGKPGTNITITIMRKGLTMPREFTITRAIIQIKSVRTRKIDSKIGYLRIRSFTKTTAKDLDEALLKIKTENGGIKGLILDLRNNPGGLLNQAVEVASRFLEKGRLVVYTKGRNKAQNMRFVTDRDDGNTEFPLVILVNAGSASASEIVAGALQDLKRALIMGTQSFGKGSVQTIVPLSDGSGLRLTTARYFTPSGKIIQENGITPDVMVENKPVLLKAKKEDKKVIRLNAIREKDLDQHLQGQTEKGKKNVPEKIEGAKKEGDIEEIDYRDLQLLRAMDLLKGLILFEKDRTSSGTAQAG